jgi:osmotically-inducible protein OsmY
LRAVLGGDTNRLQVRPGIAEAGSRAQPTDEEIEVAFRDALTFEPYAAVGQVHLDVERGRGVLQGRVSTLRGKADAEALAWATRGVTDVRNELSVQPRAAADDQTIEGTLEAALELNAYTEPLEIRAESRNGHVIVTGRAPTLFEKAQVEAVAATIPGVRSVDNRIITEAASALTASQ